MSFYKGLRSILAGFIFLLPSSLSAQGYRIEIQVQGLAGDTVILGEYFTSRMVPKDTIVVDQKGRGVFEGETAFVGGLYLVYYSSRYYFDMLLGDDQEFALTADTSDLAGTVKFTGSKNNQVFQDYKDFLQQKREELQHQQSLLAGAGSASDTAQIKEKQEEINGEMEFYMDRIEAEHASLFVNDFIGATREALPPDELLNGQKRHDDSIHYFYYREHYFDRFDPFNVRLLHTPLYENKIMNYLSRAVVQHPDSLIAASDFLLEGSKVDEDLYRYMLITLFNHFAESKFMGMDVVYFHIAEYYYIPDASWSSEEFIGKLKDNLEKNKPTLIGQKAPNLILRQVPGEHFEMAAQDTAIKRDPHIGHDFFLYDTEASYTILYFWEADCGHCQKTTPVLHEIYSRLKEQGVEVISVHAINTLEGKEKWVDFVNEHHLYDWINSWSPYSNEFRISYNLQSYPQLFVLDHDKKIVAKRITPEQAERIINNLIQIESKNNS
ncbi:MAG: thioredoxin-like domain-containing protein [Bacteroidota bacterium]